MDLRLVGCESGSCTFAIRVYADTLNPHFIEVPEKRELVALIRIKKLYIYYSVLSMTNLRPISYTNEGLCYDTEKVYYVNCKHKSL